MGHRALELDSRPAIEAGELVLRHQAMVTLPQRALIGFALVASDRG